MNVQSSITIILLPGITALIIWFLIIHSGKSFKQNQSDSEQIKKYRNLILWLTADLLIVCLAGGFLVHQDAAWHQMANENKMMPALGIIYYYLYPGYLILGGAAWLYAKTRFPEMMSQKMHVNFSILTFAPFMFLPEQDSTLFFSNSTLETIIYRGVYWLVVLVWLVAVINVFTKIGACVQKELTNDH